MSSIIISGAIANKPFSGGEAWVRLSWALGIRKLGLPIMFVEQIARPNQYDTSAESAQTFEAQVQYFGRVMKQFRLEHCASLIDGEGKPIWGLSAPELKSLARNSTALINISGHLEWAPLKEAARRKVYVDLDPGYTQLWQAKGNLGARLDGHDFFYTVGENIGADDCSIPANGLDWRPVRQPVVLDDWPAATAPPPSRFTTVGSWRGSFGPIEADGKFYGQKVHEFRKFISLPKRLSVPFEIALDIHPTETSDLQQLAENGWRLVNPRVAAGDPGGFRSYVQSSLAEFSVAQGMYVETNSGWFSDRTVRYLASGKPALVQDTGFSRNLPTGEGLLSFHTIDEAIAGAESIVARYQQHCRTARHVALEHFDSDRVLGRLLAEIGVRVPRAENARNRLAAGVMP
jgi:hypothetical protein